MKKIIVTLSSLVFAITNLHAYNFTTREEMKRDLTKSHRPLKYEEAKEILFTKLDNHQGQICSIYDMKDCMITYTIPSAKVMNVEHSWPQSKGAVGDAKSDLHHLYISDSNLNSIRSSLPYCEVVNVAWQKYDVKRGYSRFGEHCFEPPVAMRGNIARGFFYFAVRYGDTIDKNQEYFLRKWHKEDPADQEEIERNNQIEKFQGNRNPFVDQANLVDKIQDL